jgi:hypothetical protein
MKMLKVIKIIIFSFLLTAPAVFCPDASATFDLSYILTEGGYRLEFDRTNFSRGITVTISSNIAKRYEIRQRIESPLRNRDNPSSTISSNFVVRGLRGSNKYGDLRIPPGDIAVRNDELIYVSAPAGTQDSFTLVYAIIKSQELTPGHYKGRIVLILRPIDSVQDQAIQPIDVYATISDDGTLSSVSIKPAEGFSSIVLMPSDNSGMRSSANAVVTINGTFREPFKIMQMIPRPIQSQGSKSIDYRDVLFSVPDAKIGVAINQPTPLANRIQTVYSSRPDGSADKVFVIAYSLANPLSLVAGNYSSRIQYILESSGRQINLGALDLEIKQDRIFEVSVSPQDQRYSINFDNLKASDGPRTNEVLIEVKTNTARKYQVTQDVLSALTSIEGETIPSKYFSMRTLPINNTKGNLKIVDKVLVEKGSSLLFVSDNDGSADSFKVIYELTVPVDLRAGNYSSRITYTLTEI